ncbi:MAG: hypothetical protein QM655_09330 [Nocardioidaceae bacterium]
MTRTRIALVAAAAGTLALTGCSALSPNTAARIGDTRITTSDLDQFARGFCAYQTAASQPQSNQVTRSTALTIMVRSRLGEEFGSGPIDESQISQAVTSVEPVLTKLSRDERKEFLDEVRASVTADQYATNAAVAANGGSQPADLQSATDQIYEEWSKKADVRLDPRFGEWTGTQAQQASGSLSVAAKKASDPDASTPAGRTCSL